jgi:AraC-like DNA-binding protein
MLAAAPGLPSPPTREIVMSVVSACVEKVAGGNSLRFIQKVSGVTRASLLLWMHGRKLPMLGNLMTLCYQADVPVGHILGGVATISSHSHVRIRDNSGGSNRKYDDSELNRIRAAMQPVLDENPPPSIKKVASRLGLSVSTLKRHFPEIYSAINQRHADYKKDIYDKDRLHAMLLKAQIEEPPPSLNEVARRSGCSRQYVKLRFPEECRVIIERHDSHRRGPYNREKIELMLGEFLLLNPPMCLTACAVFIGCSTRCLRRTSPALSHRISTRYAIHWRQSLARQRERDSRIIKGAIRAMKAEGTKPTVERLKKRLPNVPMYRPIVEALISEESK